MITKWPVGFNKEKALLGAYSVRYSRRFVDSSSWDESIVVSVSGRGHWPLSPLSYRHICTTAHCPAQHDHLTTTSRLSGVWTRETAGPSGAGCGTHLFLFSSKRLCCIVHVPPIRMFTLPSICEAKAFTEGEGSEATSCLLGVMWSPANGGNMNGWWLSWLPVLVTQCAQWVIWQLSSGSKFRFIHTESSHSRIPFNNSLGLRLHLDNYFHSTVPWSNSCPACGIKIS